MATNKGYQTLSMLLRKKAHLLNAHILHLMFSMAGTLENPSSRDHEANTMANINIHIFRDVLCDLDLWHSVGGDLEKSLFEHFFELISANGSYIRMLRDFSMVEKSLAILKKDECSPPTVTIQMNLLNGLLRTNPRVSDVLCFALFTAASLIEAEDERTSDQNEIVTKRVILRNRCLKLFHALLYTEK